MSKADREREKRIAALVKRGHATGNEIIMAQFGEMPVGLDQDTPLLDPITFHSVREDPGYKAFRRMTEYAHIKPDEAGRKIYLNRFLLGGPGKIMGLFAGRMAVARAHDLGEAAVEAFTGRGGEVGLAFSAAIMGATLLSSFRYAMFSSLVKAINPSLANIVGEETMHILATKGEEQSWTVQNAFRANAIDEMRNNSSILTNVAQAIDMLITMMPISYFQQDQEILGRLFNLAVRGYPQHGRLPTDAAEGQAFLLDMGIKAPSEVHLYFQAKQFGAVREVFYRHKKDHLGLLFPPSAEINIGINSYRNQAVLSVYWKDAFPVMLGEMFRLLGNSKSLERFGYDEDTKDLKGVPQPLRPQDAYAEPRHLLGGPL